ncbi:ABC transporter substrate-binding protein [Halobellus sp. GM3]|uniref:ABC transporter substrate-binding protein n=1 Tax=Halobellus sp. GM3 TaxID=3458410 RepID=UPI00403DF2A2
MRSHNSHESVYSRRRLLRTGAVTSAVLLAGCSGNGDDGSGSTGEDGSGDSGSDGESQTQLRVGLEDEPRHDYDPFIALRSLSTRINHHIYDMLYEYDENYQIQPKVATAEPEVERSGQRYIIEITDQARFQNGDPVTAEDVLYSFVGRIEEEAPTSGEISYLDTESSAVVDDTTVQLDLKQVVAPFRERLMTHIVPKSVREEDPEGFYNNPVGSGPYRYVDHVEGDYIDLERWDDYWDDPQPNIPSIRWMPIPDNSARLSQLLAGDIHATTRLPPADWNTIESNEDCTNDSTNGFAPLYIEFNCRDGPTANPDVRKGIAYAFSTEEFINNVLNGEGQRLVSPLTDTILENWELPVEEYAELKPGYDPERAAELLDGNVPDGWEPQLVSLNRGYYPRFNEMLAGRLQALSEYGVDINPQVQQYGSGRFADVVFSGDAEDVAMFGLGYGNSILDPDDFIWNLFYEEQAGITQGNYYQDEDFHSRIEEARRTVDRERRSELYDSIIREILEQTISHPVAVANAHIGKRTVVQDYPPIGLPMEMLRAYSPRNNASLQG